MLKVDGRAWMDTSPPNEDYEYENAACLVIVERTDENEIRLGISLYESDDIDNATVYMTLSEASRLSHMLGLAVLANEAAAHEAAKLSA